MAMGEIITRSLYSSVLAIGFLGSHLITSAPPIAVAAPRLKVQMNPELTFLERWVGEWEGTGTSDGKPVRDRMTIQWTLNHRFLRFTYIAQEGDRYKGEGYFWYNPQLKRYEWWEFNNGRWPVRQHIGDRTQDQLVLEENDGDRRMRLIFTFSDNNTLEMTEGFVEGDQAKPYVVMKFRRKLDQTP